MTTARTGVVRAYVSFMQKSGDFFQLHGDSTTYVDALLTQVCATAAMFSSHCVYALNSWKLRHSPSVSRNHTFYMHLQNMSQAYKVEIIVYRFQIIRSLLKVNIFYKYFFKKLTSLIFRNSRQFLNFYYMKCFLVCRQTST